MGSTVVLIPMGPGENDALDVIDRLAQKNGHRVDPRPLNHEWAVAITGPNETSDEMTEIYSEARRYLEV
ncbi:hypothetical protein [Methylobacterium sp. SI9]|uniref:hypothetical protein n=1 Tax=Methylobacterium guangdongense TaxID=3138811 RepID=UPI00313B2B61